MNNERNKQRGKRPSRQNKEYSPWYSWNSYIENIVLPDNLCKIGSFAFYGCSKVANITIPLNCGDIGVGAFAGCWGLRGVHIKDLNNWCKIYFPLYMSFGNPDRLYEGTNPLYYAGHLYLNGVPVTEVKGSVGKSMSGNLDLISVEIPDGETRIEA